MRDDLQKLIDRSVELLKDVQKVLDVRQNEGVSLFQVNNLASRGANLIHSVTGAKSVYADNLRNTLKQKSVDAQFDGVVGVLQAFHLDLSKGYLISIRHEVEAIVVSEILTQARKLARTKGVHPAAVVIVACAAAEEFLRNWCEEKRISIPEKQRSMAKFGQELRRHGHIDLPMERRLQSWVDYRNDAAHGAHWEKITHEIANRLSRWTELILHSVDFSLIFSGL